jgi:hypothetical protein
VTIEQAIYGRQESGGQAVLARSPGFSPNWLQEAERLCVDFGERIDTLTCGGAVFAQPFGKQHVAIVQAADQGLDATGRPGPLGFRILVLTRSAYHGLGGDPFVIADNFPPYWNVRGDLPVLYLPAQPLQSRTIDQVVQVLKRSDAPVLLGGCQALIDGGRLVLERPSPDASMMRALWTLLPTSTRCDLWPASFAFSNRLRFHAVVLPRPAAEEIPGYITEQQAGDYPEGRYELGLQVAAESGNQRDLDALFERRSRKETWRLGLILLAGLVVLVPLVEWINRTPSKSLSGPVLSAPGEYPHLEWHERHELTQALSKFAADRHITIRKGASPEKMLETIAENLGPGLEGRFARDEFARGPIQRSLRVLLWKYGDKDYADPKLNSLEMVDRLRRYAPPVEEKQEKATGL